MNRLLLVCSGSVCNPNGGSSISGCYVNGVERLCVSCVSVIDKCWLDTHKEKVPETERMCIKCFEVWYAGFKKKGMSKKGQKRIDDYIKNRKASESHAITPDNSNQF